MRIVLPVFLWVSAFGLTAVTGVAEALTRGLPCDYPTKPGTYRKDGWEYTYTITGKGTRSETREGVLKKDGKQVGGGKGEIIETPLGRLQYFQDRYNSGWLNTLTYDMPVFPGDAEKGAKKYLPKDE